MNPLLSSRFRTGHAPGRRAGVRRHIGLSDPPAAPTRLITSRLVTSRLLAALATAVIGASPLASSAQAPRTANAGSVPAASSGSAGPGDSGLPVSSGASASSRLAALSDVERCLLERLRTADPRATVADVHADCSPPLPPPGTPGAELLAGQAEPGETAPAATSAEAPALAGAGGETIQVTDMSSGDQLPALATIGAPVERRVLSESRLWSERFALLPHRPNYILPVSHATSDLGPSSEVLQRNEVKLQLSFKFPLTPPLLEGRAALFFAYTGQYWWQAYNKDISAPFREYGHEPEIFAAWRPSFSLLGWSARTFTAGFNHQSNGRAGDLSRSWNRLFAEMTLDRPDGWWLSLRPWWRIPEDEKTDPNSPRGDDNPEISRYAGDAEIRLGHVGATDNWTVTVRGGLRNGSKGSMQLDWSRPTGFSPHLRWYAQYFDGYGESLLDHDERLRRFGVGVMLNDWF